MRREIVNRLLYIAFLLYILLLLGTQCGHLFWLLQVHTDLRTVYDLDPLAARHSWGFAGAALLLIVMIVGPFCVVTLVRKYGNTECTWSGGRKGLMFFWPVSLAIYNSQVILFIVSTVDLFLSLTWRLTYAACACHSDTDRLLNLTMSDDVLLHCQCVVPGEDCHVQLSTTDTSLISDHDLRWRGSQYHGNVTVTELDSINDVNDWLDSADIDTNFQYVLVLAKMSTLVTVMHFPLWLLDHYLLNMASSLEDADDSVQPESTRSKISEIVTELMAHTVYCFSENIDGFSLLDEYLELSVFFKGNGYLRDAILAFLGSNIILVSGYNGIAHLLRGQTLVTLVVRCLIVTLNNMPFIIIRIYMLWNVGGSRILETGVSTTFFFFVAKEGIFLVGYFLECGFNIYQYRRDSKKAAYEKQNSALESSQSTTLTDTFNGSDHGLGNSARSDIFDEINLEPEQPRKRTKRPKMARRQDSLLEDEQMEGYDDRYDITVTELPKSYRKKQKSRREDDDSNVHSNIELHNNRAFDDVPENNLQTTISPVKRHRSTRPKRHTIPDDTDIAQKYTTEVRYTAPDIDV